MKKQQLLCDKCPSCFKGKCGHKVLWGKNACLMRDGRPIGKIGGEYVCEPLESNLGAKSGR